MRKQLRVVLIGLVLLSALLIGIPARSTRAATSLYPNLKSLPPRDLRFDRTDVSVDGSGVMHNVLRFSNTAYNVGAERLVIWGQIDPATQSGPAYQRVYDDAGGSIDYQVGTLYYHAVHNHYHLEGWGTYQLWIKAEYDKWISSGRSVGQAKKVGTKTTSCVMDEEFIQTLPNTPYPAVYGGGGCMPNSQNVLSEGLSPGWGDTYDYFRYEQWIDLDQETLADGQYVLRTVSDPTNKIYESPNKSDSSRESEQDNEAITTFMVQGGALVDSDPPGGTIAINHVDTSTTSTKVNVDVLGRDDVSGIAQVRLSNNGTNWATYTYSSSGNSTSMTIAWDLANTAYGGSTATGTRYVYAQFQDNTGKWSSTFNDSITLVGAPQPTTYSSTILADNPISYWRLDETSGTTAIDSKGSNTGTYMNSPAQGAASLLATESDAAVRFDGINDHVVVLNNATLSPVTIVSLEAWIKPNALPASGSFASVLTKPESYSLQFNGSQLEFTIIQSGTRRRLQAPAGAIAVGQTYHIVGTFDGAMQRLYINGAQAGSASLTGNISTNTNSLYIGSWNGSSEFFNGVIDEVVVYNTALASSRVATHYNTGSGSSTPTAPNPPSGLTAAAISSSQINLSWTDSSSDEGNFVLERSTDSGFASVTSKTLAANITSYQDTGLTAGTTYYYRVKATNTGGSSAYSNTTSATTQSSTPTVPGAPGNLTATAISSSQITLTWLDNSTNEDNFILDRSTTSGFTSGTVTSITVPANNAGTQVSYQDTGLIANTTYYYRVKAVNAAGSSIYSNTASAITPALGVPNSPSNLAATRSGPVSRQTIKLTWSDNSNNENSFVLERSTSNTFATVTTFTISANFVSYTDSSVARNTTYYYRIKARNSSGDSSYSNVASATTR